VPNPERRKDDRTPVSQTVRVQGHAPNGTPWEEATTSEDASRGGTCFPLRQVVLIPGQVLRLSMPLPESFRRFAVDPSYHVYGLVRSVRRSRTGKRVGVMYLGHRPPEGFERKPGGRYPPPRDQPPEARDRRVHRRVDVTLSLRLRRVDAAGEAVLDEPSVTEDLGAGGARVLTTLEVAPGAVVAIEPKHVFHTRAEVRNVFIGGDGIPRLNLAFLDGAPAELAQVTGRPPRA